MQLLEEYTSAVRTFAAKAVMALVPAHEPFLADLQHETVDHIADGDFAERATGMSTGLTKICGEAPVSTTAVAHSTLDEWYLMLWQLASTLAAAQSRAVLASVQTICSKTGNAISANGQPISHDLILDMIERVEGEVDDHGRLRGFRFVTSEATRKAIEALGPMSPAQEARLKTIMADKRRKTDAAKRFRRLGRGSG